MTTRSYEYGWSHGGKSDFGLLLLRLRKRNDETYEQQGRRLGYSVGSLKTYSNRKHPPSAAVRNAVILCYHLSGNERAVALGDEPLLEREAI